MNSDNQPVTVPFLQNLKSHRLLFFIALPVCFVVCVAIVSCLPKYYKSTFVITRESEQAVEVNRAITLNQPSNYDLGIARTDNAVQANGYANILSSDDFLYGLLDTPVSTLDHSWKGTLGEFLSEQQKQPFWSRWMSRVAASDSIEPIAYNAEDGWYTERAVETINTLRSSIKADLNYETKFVTISCTAQDPLVATQMARAVNARLMETVDRYEMEKMQGILLQLQTRAEQAEADNNAEMAASFRRQAAVYQAQMIHHPAFMTLTAPSVSYKKAGPSRWKMPLVLTLLLGICLLGWVERKNIMRYIAG